MNLLNKQAVKAPVAGAASTAAVGALGGMSIGALTSLFQSRPTVKNILRNALVGAGAGGLAGATLGGVAGHYLPELFEKDVNVTNMTKTFPLETEEIKLPDPTSPTNFTGRLGEAERFAKQNPRLSTVASGLLPVVGPAAREHLVGNSSAEGLAPVVGGSLAGAVAANIGNAVRNRRAGRKGKLISLLPTIAGSLAGVVGGDVYRNL